MEKRMKWLIVLNIILIILVVGLSIFITYDKVLRNDSEDKNIPHDDNVTSIKINDDLDYVYNASYSYENKYTEYSRTIWGDDDKIITISNFGIPVDFRTVRQYVSDLTVPYININSSYASTVNNELENLYIEYAKNFDVCADDMAKYSVGCTEILTYRTYNYRDILSVVVIYGMQVTSNWILSYNTYNFDLTTGSEITYNDMISMLGYNKDTLLQSQETLLKNKMDELWKNIDLSTDCVVEGNNMNCYDIANKMLEDSINDKSILFFANNDGVLNIFAIPYFNGALNGDINKYLIKVEL
ncbi:MAG: hypothetical protein ACI310_02980 [Bacilli bacterium]